MARTFYLTTPIYYVNAPPHLGHAYTTIMADTMCLYRRLAGDLAYFLTGTDEHGDNIARAAATGGQTPQAYADRISGAFRETWQRLGISHDDFIRTTEERHKRIVQAILQKLYDAGELYFGEYGGNYCFGCERFYTDKELVDGKCPDHQTPPTFIKEQNYFFRMSRYQEWLVRYIAERPDFIRPERYRNEILAFLRTPLEDLCISRPKSRLQWGIPLPFDANFVTYVWFDALINYVSALGGPGAETFETFWPHVQHLIGKDILKPHAAYWPPMLKAAGLPVYQHLNVHGYWTVNGQKMSKSLGNIAEPLPMQEKYGEAFRYFLLRESVFGLDSDFSEDALVARLNADLANDLGNLVSRVTTLLVNFAKGAVPRPGPETARESEVRASLEKARGEVHDAMEEFAFQRALIAIWELIGVLNRYVDSTAPWVLAKEAAKRERLDTVLYTLGESLRCLAILLAAFLPITSERIRQALGLAGTPISLDDLAWGKLPPGIRVLKAPALFPRVMSAVETGSSGERAGARASTQRSGAQPRISLEEFAKVDLRVAEVVAADRVEKSKKLLKLTVRVGAETRTLVAGIAEHYDPAALVGKKVVVVANLESATLMGVISEGMVLAAVEGSHLALVILDRDIPPGAKVR